MRCPFPQSFPRPGGKGSADRITVPCGKCYTCLSNKRSQWSFRLEQELRDSSSAFFITLTYENEHVRIGPTGYPSVCKRDVQLFLKRVRRSFPKSRIRYFVVAEYGPSTFRPHYHAILFGLPFQSIDECFGGISPIWGLGNVHVGSVTGNSIGYCAKYCISKSDVPDYLEPVFSLMSRKPGIGSGYIDRNRDWHDNGYDPRFYAIKPGGFKVDLPRFYKDRIFSKETLESRIVHDDTLERKADFDRRFPLDNFFQHEFESSLYREEMIKNRVLKQSKL